MMQPISRAVLGLARLTLLEARRTAVGKAALAAIAISLGLALFMDRIVITDQERATVVTYAVIVRFTIVLTLGLAIIANTVRDLNERIIDNFLALPLTRMQYALGKWLGWTLVAVLCALSAGLPLFGFSGTPGRLQWTLSFAAEAVVVFRAYLIGREIVIVDRRQTLPITRAADAQTYTIMTAKIAAAVMVVPQS